MFITSSSDLHQVFYVSRCLATPLQVEEILAVSRRNNALHGVTGALLFTGGCFAQVLEGEHDILQLTLTKIRADLRHDRLAVLATGKIDDRRFAAWRMAYSETNGADDLLNQLLEKPVMDKSRADRLLARMFKNISPDVT